MATEKQIQRAIGSVGDLLSSHDGDTDLSRFGGHETAVSFTREELGETDPGPWSHQREAMELVAHNDRVAWRGAQGIGKDWAAARIALWWTYAKGGLTLISGPTARQVNEILMRKEIARAFRRAYDLPGELYTNSLRIHDQEAGILAFTSSEASGLTGFHDSRVLAILTEAQAVERHGWEGLMACTTGEDDRLLAIGNPLHPTGMFYEVSRPDSGWQTLQTAATDHPNITGETHVPGGPSEAWLERMREMWGEGSPMLTARVGGEFPRDSVEGLYRASWVDAAIGREPEATEAEPVVAVDVARHGMDESVATVVRGSTVERLESWSGASTSETAEKVKAVADEAGVLKRQELGFKMREVLKAKGEPVPPHGAIVVDEVGVGGGVLDQLEDDDWPVKGFKGSKSAKQDRRHANARAEAYWALRELLEDGVVSLPDDRRLREELLAVKWSPDSKGRVQIEAKEDIKSRIGRSPDRLDSVCMAFSRAGRKGGGLSAEAMQTKW